MAMPCNSASSRSSRHRSSLPSKLTSNGSTSIFPLRPLPLLGSTGISLLCSIGAAFTITFRCCLWCFTFTVIGSCPTMFLSTRQTLSPAFESTSFTSLMLRTLALSSPSIPNSPARSSRLLLMNAALPISFRITDEMVPLPPRIFPYISIHRAYRLVPSRQYPIHRASSSSQSGSPSPHSLMACSHLGHLAA